MSNPHDRNRVLLDAIQRADTQLDGILPRSVPGLQKAFGDDTELVGALQMRWYTRLNGRIEVEQELVSDLGAAVISAWRLTRSDSPGLRMVLDQTAETPPSPEIGLMLAKARRKEHIMIALMAGLATFDNDRAAELGAEIEQVARQEPDIRPQEAGSARVSLIARLRAKLAA